MSKLKKISACLFSGIVLFGTISFARTGTVNAPNGLVLRESASKSANPITTVSDDETVEILEENGEWYKVKYGNYEGYMFAEYVEAEPVVEEETSTEEKPQVEEQNTQIEQQPVENKENEYPKNAVINANVNMYLIPSITSKVITNIEQTKTITVNYELNNWSNVTYEGTTRLGKKILHKFTNNKCR